MIRFLFLSVLFHTLMLSAVFLLLKPATDAMETPPVKFTQGEVFVGQAPAPAPSPSPSPALPLPDSTSGAEVAKADPPENHGATIGAPDGEAKLTQAIVVSYPPLSTRLGEEGKVTIAFEISAEGVLGNIHAVRSSGFPRLDMAALQAISRAQYAAAVRSGKPINSQRELTVEFRLNQPVKVSP